MVVVALTLAFDLTQPLGVAGGMPYIALPLLGLLARSTKIVLAAAACGTAFALAGMALSPQGLEYSIVVTNRAMTVALIWIVAYTALRHLKVGRELRAKLREQALTDPLTGLYNRRHVFAGIDQQLKRYERYAEIFSIILIDADHFKHVNDNYGHSTGDATLRLIAKVCTAAVRKIDVVGRFGGEEFIILLPHTRADEATVVAERIRSDMGKLSREMLDGAVLVTLSLGVAEVGPQAADFNKLLAAADKALYMAKNSGRNRVAVIDSETSKMATADAA
ncbi:MAG: GGDEF domain-containing protein [Woeseia sp.]|nr:GGDEF domain-containing protein [Woeseia sp.]NNE59720.1 GGDEF domain-containing protein [Woeseia sp.]NNL55822.1 GGDEF domain-containing protein [Woeseia sp.]